MFRDDLQVLLPRDRSSARESMCFLEFVVDVNFDLHLAGRTRAFEVKFDRYNEECE